MRPQVISDVKPAAPIQFEISRSLTLSVAAISLLCTAAEVLLAASPVLLMRDSQNTENPFGSYYAEILRAEGIMSFDELDLVSLDAATDPSEVLASYKTILTAEMDLSASQQTLLRNFVRSGGTLVSSRPSAAMADMFGLQRTGQQSEQILQYFGVNPASEITGGIKNGALQFHGAATRYGLQGATPLAYFYSGANAASPRPAVTSSSYGAGRAIAFAFDPARSVVLTRQGNPAWQNTEGDDIPEYRPHDMFARQDGTTYYDPARMTIPQADELQRVLSNVIISESSMPLPRLWYLPGLHKSIMINTGDGEDNYDSQFNQILNDAASYGGKFSVYLRDFGVANTSAAQEAQWRAAGHEVGVHAYGDGPDGTGAESSLTDAYGRVTSALYDKFGHRSRTARNHTIDWTGWVDMARIESGYGTQLDTNYYHYLNTSRLNPVSSNGYFTGSGLPQRFIDSDGSLLPIYQAATQWPDEWFANAGLSATQTTSIIKGMFAAAEEQGYYSAFVNNIHPVRYYGADSITRTWANAVWQYCEQNDIPMWSAEMLLDYTRARSTSRFSNVVFDDEELHFDFNLGNGGSDLTIMLPADWKRDDLLSVAINGIAVDWTLENIKGLNYAMFTPFVSEGQIVATYGTSLLVGDYNSDGVVDAPDYVVWRNSLESATSLAADGNHDGLVDEHDYDLWRANFGASTRSPISSPSVPEATVFQMAILGALLYTGRRIRSEIDNKG